MNDSKLICERELEMFFKVKLFFKIEIPNSMNP